MRYLTLLLSLLLSLGAKAQIDTCDEHIHAVSDTPCTYRILHLAVDSLPNTSYSWEGPGAWTALGDSVMRATILPTQTGSYIVTGRRGICIYKDTVVVYARSTPAAPTIISLNSPVCTGDTLKAQAATTAMDMDFYFFGPETAQGSRFFQQGSLGSGWITRPNMQESMTGKYGVYQISIEGCYSDTTYFYVEVDTCTLNVADIDNNELFIPSLLQSSDPVFKPIFKSENTAYKMQVYDQTGKKVFETNNSEYWDRSAYQGMYYYIITNETKIYKGRVILL